MMEKEHKIDSSLFEQIELYLKSTGFVQRTLADTPSDSLQVVNRNFVTLNGPTTSRPTGSIMGQFYLDTTIKKSIWWNGTNWQDSQGNVV